eukprot:8732604-Karenia_brevis.AAC.1
MSPYHDTEDTATHRRYCSGFTLCQGIPGLMNRGFDDTMKHMGASIELKGRLWPPRQGALNNESKAGTDAQSWSLEPHATRA